MTASKRHPEQKGFSHEDSLIVEPLTAFLSQTITALKPHPLADELQEQLNQIRLELIDKKNSFAKKYVAASLIKPVLDKVKELKIDKLTYFDMDKVQSTLENIRKKVNNPSEVDIILTEAKNKDTKHEDAISYAAFTATLFQAKKIDPITADLDIIFKNLENMREKLKQFSQQDVKGDRNITAGNLANEILNITRILKDRNVDPNEKLKLTLDTMDAIKKAWEKTFKVSYAKIQDVERSSSSMRKKDKKLSLKQIFQDFNREEEKQINQTLLTLKKDIDAQAAAQPSKMAAKK